MALLSTVMLALTMLAAAAPAAPATDNLPVAGAHGIRSFLHGGSHGGQPTSPSLPRPGIPGFKTDDRGCPAHGCPAAGQACRGPYNQCPALCADGVACPAVAGTPPGQQCQSREHNPFMPLFHVVGNFTNGDGVQPIAINDVSSVIQYKGVLHIFHQFGQCGWAHSLSHDGGAHWKNARYPLTPDLGRDPKYSYDACGCYDGSLTLDANVNGGAPVILYSPCKSWAAANASTVAAAAAAAASLLGDQPYMAVARPTDLNDPELRYWTKDPQNPVAFPGGVGGSDLGQLWRNGERWEGLTDGKMFSSDASSLHSFYLNRAARGFPGGGSGGQWFVELPGSIDGAGTATANATATAGTPTHLISTSNGQRYSAGIYDPAAEKFTVTDENLLVDCGQLNGRNSYTFATLQCSRAAAGQRRCFSVAWLSPHRLPTTAAGRPGERRFPPLFPPGPGPVCRWSISAPSSHPPSVPRKSQPRFDARTSLTLRDRSIRLAAGCWLLQPLRRPTPPSP
eukprot:SAG22_NODE_808_length_7080_cov_4.802034_2_plen_509_part_00